ADLGRYGRVVVQPDILPLAVRSAPVGAVLPFVLARARGDEPEAVDRGLDLHDLALLRSIPPLDRVDLPRERVEPGPLALLDEQRQLVVCRPLGDSPLDEVDLLARELDLAPRL